MLKARLGDSGLSSTVDEIGEKLAVALAELREFARGIHPAFLSERGVGAAVEALVARAPLEVDAVVDLGERLPAPVEAAAYFVVAEGLTNVDPLCRHAPGVACGSPASATRSRSWWPTTASAVRRSRAAPGCAG